MKRLFLTLLSLTLFTGRAYSAETSQVGQADLAHRLVHSFYQLEEMKQQLGVILKGIDEDHLAIAPTKRVLSQINSAQNLLKEGIGKLDDGAALLLLSQRVELSKGMLTLGLSIVSNAFSQAGDVDEESTQALDKVKALVKTLGSVN